MLHQTEIHFGSAKDASLLKPHDTKHPTIFKASFANFDV
jgi:hypothetical protein